LWWCFLVFFTAEAMEATPPAHPPPPVLLAKWAYAGWRPPF
jgi:hypothetical protein